MSCDVGRRSSSDPVLLWLWHRQAATALIRPLAWERPYVMGAALKSKKKKSTYIYIYRCYVYYWLVGVHVFLCSVS